MGCYLNDIIITGKNTEEHLNHLSRVLEQLQDKGFRLKKDKCQFLQSSVEHLGHVIDTNGLHTTPTKQQAIVEAREWRPWHRATCGSRVWTLTLSPLPSSIFRAKQWRAYHYTMGVASWTAEAHTCGFRKTVPGQDVLSWLTSILSGWRFSWWSRPSWRIPLLSSHCLFLHRLACQINWY